MSFNVEEVQSVFASFDRDGNGHLDTKELGQALRSLGHFVPKKSIRRILQANDDDFSGTLCIEEFTRLAQALADSTDEVEAKCPKGHYMIHRTTKPPMYPGPPSCDVCHEGIDPASGFNNCPYCEYDVCTPCSGSHGIPEPIHCAKQHNMVRCNSSPSEYHGCNPQCDICKQRIEPTDGFAHCTPCQYDLCKSCITKQLSHQASPTAPPPSQPTPTAAPGPHRPTSADRGVKALLVGINYIGTANALRGCANDVRTMLALFKFLKIPLRETQVLCDDPGLSTATGQPSKSGIEAGFDWLLANAMPGDKLFFHYSGHGTQIHDENSSEEDKKNEALVPCDFNNGCITDVWIHDKIANLPHGVQLTAILDCCHSGTMMNLPYMFSATKASVAAARESGTLAASGSGTGHSLPANIFMISGCKDEQTSADCGDASANFKLSLDGISQRAPGGACTSALTEVLTESPNSHLVDLLDGMLKVLKGKFPQIPQLSSSHPIQASEEFRLF